MPSYAFLMHMENADQILDSSHIIGICAPVGRRITKDSVKRTVCLQRSQRSRLGSALQSRLWLARLLLVLTWARVCAALMCHPVCACAQMWFSVLPGNRFLSIWLLRLEVVKGSPLVSCTIENVLYTLTKNFGLPDIDSALCSWGCCQVFNSFLLQRSDKQNIWNLLLENSLASATFQVSLPFLLVRDSLHHSSYQFTFWSTSFLTSGSVEDVLGSCHFWVFPLHFFT